MAWGYWNAHSLAPAKMGRHGPGPTLHAARSREHSLDRDRREREQALCATAPSSARVSACPTPAAASSLNHLGGEAAAAMAAVDSAELGSWSASGAGSGGGVTGGRTANERNTLPRGKMAESDDWLAERHTLPRGKSDSETTTGSVPWPIPNKVRSEGEWCPACSSGGSRVSFHSIKEGGGGGGGSGGSSDAAAAAATSKRKSGASGSGGGSSEVLSTSLPTPPPPPFQAGAAQCSRSIIIVNSYTVYNTIA
jgi:hypothetical protein